MRVIQVRNVQLALPEALYQLRADHVKRDSRNGPVEMFPTPVTTVYERPMERVLFWKERDANPFFHLIESLWMLAGRNDVEAVARYSQNIRNYSDDGVTFHGAYGFRWRYLFGQDQLRKIIDGLKANRDDRRQVLQMWAAEHDLGRQGKDLPCNLLCTFQIAADGKLDMIVMNRSNDMIWGAYGANAVHFSYLQEYVATSVGVEQGRYYQVSANFHAYVATLEPLRGLADCARDPYQEAFPADGHFMDPYSAGAVAPFPLMSSDRETWHADLEMFFTDYNAAGFRDPFFRRVAIPMAKAHAAFKSTSPSRFGRALDHLQEVRATDWQRAAIEWITRRQHRLQKAQDDGVAYE